MTSKSVKSFIVDIFEDGLKEDMVIFEPNFVKQYPAFSTKYLEHHFNYNMNNVGGGVTDKDFLESYEKLVLPKRWQKPYAEINNRYTSETKELVF